MCDADDTGVGIYIMKSLSDGNVVSVSAVYIVYIVYVVGVCACDESYLRRQAWCNA